MDTTVIIAYFIAWITRILSILIVLGMLALLPIGVWAHINGNTLVAGLGMGFGIPVWLCVCVLLSYTSETIIYFHKVEKANERERQLKSNKTPLAESV